MMYYSPESEADSTEEKKGNSDSEDEVLIYPYPDEQCSRTFPVPDSFRLRVRKRKSSGKHNLMAGFASSQSAMSTSLSSPISILASSPSGSSSNSNSGFIHSSGPLSAPATFSWGAHSPIPPRCSPVVVVPTPTSPYLLSPGRDNYASPPHTTTVSTMGVGFSGSAVMTSSPLMPSPLDAGRGCSPLLAPPRSSSSLSRSSPLIGGPGSGPGPAVTSSSFLPGGPLYTGSDGSGGVMSVASSLQSVTTSDPHLTKPGIPVGIAVARQRHKETTSSHGNTSISSLQTKDDPAPPAAWPFHLLPSTHHALPPTHHALPPTHHALPPTHHALPPTHHALPPTHLPHHPSGSGSTLPPSLLLPGASLPQSHPSMPLQDYGRYLTSAAGGSNNSSTSNPAAPSPGSRPSAFSPTQTYQQQQAQAVAGTSAQAATPGGLQAVAAAGAPVAGTNPFWSPFSSYYPFLLHSAAAYHQQAAAASMPTASLTALQHYHHQLLMLHAQQNLYSGEKGILDPYSALHHLQRQSTALAVPVPGSSTPVPGSSAPVPGSGTPVPGSSSTDVHLSVAGTSKEESKPGIIPQDDSGLGLDSSRLDHSSSSRGRHDSTSSSRGRHMSANVRAPSYLSSTPNTTLEGSTSNLLRPSIPLLPLDFTTGRGSISGLRGDSPSSESSVVIKSPKVDRSSRSSTPLNRSTTPLNRSTTPLDRSTTPLITNRARTPSDLQNLSTGLTSTPTGAFTSVRRPPANLTCIPGGAGSQAKEEKKGDRSSEEDNISVGTESIEANNTLPNHTSPTQQSIEELSAVPGGPNTNSQKLSLSPIEVLTKKMWQCKQDVQNNSDKSVIGKPSKIRCVDQKFLSGERLPENPTNHNLKESIVAEPSDLQIVHENSFGKDVVDIAATHNTAVCHSQVKSEQGIVQPQAEREENGLHLLYEGIQKQLSRTPSADDQYSKLSHLADASVTNKSRDNGLRQHQPLDERTGEFILKDDKENDLKRDMYLANQLIDFATENLQQKPAKIIVRHSSVDSPLSRHQHFDDVTEEGGDLRRADLLRTPSKVTLGLLCDVATERMAEEEGLTGTAQLRIARSRSDDPERHNIRRTSPASKQNIREFIERRSSRSSEGHSPARLNSGSPLKAGSSPYRTGSASSPYRLVGSPVKGGMGDIDEMDAWEISMRLDMAHIQKKYREKYRELYMLESRKERSRKTSGRQAQPPTPYKRSSSDHKNSNNRSAASPMTTPVKSAKSPKHSIETATPTVIPIQKDSIDSEEIKVKHSDTTALHVENNNSPLTSPCKSSPLPDESPVTSPPVVSSFHETFAKFKKSYHNNRGGVNNRYNGNNNPNNVANGDSRSLSNPSLTGSSMLKVKIDRPTPFANWLRLSSTGSNGTSESLSPSIIKQESKVYHQPPLSPNSTADNGYADVKSERIADDGEELVNGGHQHKPEVAKVFKRKMSHRTSDEGEVSDKSYVDGSRSPKKKAKYEKYVVACESYESKATYEEDFSSDERRKAKRREHKRHKDKSHHHRRSQNHYHQTHPDQNNHHDNITHISHNAARTTTDNTDFTKMMVGKKKWMRMHNHEPEELDKISNYVSAPSIGDDMNDNDDVVKVKREYNDGYEEDYDAKSYKEHKKDKKRDKEKKKKRSKDKKRQKVHVRDENDYICEIMDRTPTPSSGGRVNIKQEAAAAVKMEAIDDEPNDVKEEPVEYDWADIEEMMKASELTESKLRDSQRILTRIGGHFYPGRITEISPPDIYGILVDRERGNKPHICSREEVLTKAILEVSPGRIEALQPGARVCAYWSSKYHYLHPGTVVENTQGLNLPRGYVVIELDDGDSRDFHVDSIRFLPPKYPLVVGESDPFNGLGQVRRRRTSSIEASPNKKPGAFPSKKSTEKKSEKSGKRWKSEITPNNLKIRIRSPEADTPPPGPAPGEWGCTVKLEEREPPVLTPQDDIRHPGLTPGSGNHLCPKLEPGLNDDDNSHFQLPPTSIAGGGQHGDPGAGLMIRDDDQDSAFESVGRGEEEDDLDDLDSADIQVNYERRRMPSADKSKIRAFLPPSHLLWAWKDKGVKPKNKTRKIFHTSIFRDDEVLKVGDSAVFLSTSRPDRPYIGKLEDMWESWSGNMKVRVRWFYHSEEAEGTGEGGRRAVDLRLPGALFESSHFDENDIQTISHKCDVVPVDEFASRLACTPGLREAIYENNELYYTAGTYDPVVGTLSFQPNVFDI